MRVFICGSCVFGALKWASELHNWNYGWGEAPGGAGKLSPDPLEEQHVLFYTEPAVQPK